MRTLPAMLLLACLAWAATPKNVVIKKKGGDIVRGAIMSELESGYLVKVAGGKTVKIAFTDIADLTEVSDAPGPGVAPPPPPPPPPPPEAPSSAPAPAPVQPAAMVPPGPAPVQAQAGANEGPCEAGEAYVQLKPGNEVAGHVCVDRTEVTVAQYQACVTAQLCTADDLDCGRAANWGRPDRVSHPMNCVNARQAEAFCTAKRARLPTAEEFSALANLGDGWYAWGSNEPKGRACWSGEESRDGTCPVGSYPRGVGLARVYDLAGNVWEWTSSTRRGSRIFMGGAWNDSRARRLEYGSQNWNDPKVHFDDVGFRCVRTAP